MDAKKTDMYESAAIRQLMEYAAQNPEASDTAEGIARWWVKKPLDEVLPALKTLVGRGMWERLKREDRVLYRPRRKAKDRPPEGSR